MRIKYLHELGSQEAFEGFRRVEVEIPTTEDLSL